MTLLTSSHSHSNGYGRRTFLSDVGLGFTGMALGAMLAEDGRSESPASRPKSSNTKQPKIKNVIWIFLSGGVSHLETFDPKPLLNRFAGKTFDETGLDNPQKLPIYRERSRSVVGFDRDVVSKIMPLNVGYRKRGQAGIEVRIGCRTLVPLWMIFASCVLCGRRITTMRRSFSFTRGVMPWTNRNPPSVPGSAMDLAR